jgi:hypothetical protein
MKWREGDEKIETQGNGRGKQSGPGRETAGRPDVERHWRTERSGWPTLLRTVVGIQTAGLMFLDSWPLKINSQCKLAIILNQITCKSVQLI